MWTHLYIIHQYKNMDNYASTIQETIQYVSWNVQTRCIKTVRGAVKRETKRPSLLQALRSDDRKY